MNDRFRFRAWNKEEKKMYYDAQDTYDYMTGNPVIFAESFSCLLTNDEEWEVEQCTGLKDKNGNLIYEGDIVSNDYRTGVVKYGEFNCSCCDGVFGWYFDDADIRDVEFYKIIGNIHEQAEQKEEK